MKNLSEAPILINGSPPASLPSAATKVVDETPSHSSRGSLSPIPISHRCSICSATISPTPHHLEDALNSCVDCDVRVHSSCYGIEKEVDAGHWRCRWCAEARKASDSKARDKVCVFCTLPDGAYTRVSMGRWAHVVCCLFLPEVHFVDPVTMSEAVVPKDEGFRMLYQKTCSICDKRGEGVSRRCDDEDCDTYFHVTCGQALGLLAIETYPNDMLKFTGYCQMHRLVYQSRGRPNLRWLAENSTALNTDDMSNVSSSSRRIVKKIIYRLAKDLAKSCPHEGIKGAEVNAWYDDGCKEFFQKHPNLDRKGINSYIRNCGLGFYHGCLKRKLHKC